MDEIKIRKAEERDFKRIAELYKQGFSEEPYNESWTFDKSINKIKLFSRYCDIYVVLLDESIAGFIVVNPNQWCPGKIIFIEEIVVDKDFRGKGIAKQLILEIEKSYSKKGYQEVMLISNKKSKAYKLWRNLGFSEDSENLLIDKKLTV